jgi:hypothetical protein
MIGPHRPGWITYSLIASASMLEFSLGFCCLLGAEHGALARIYIALGIITLMGLLAVHEHRSA